MKKLQLLPCLFVLSIIVSCSSETELQQEQQLQIPEELLNNFTEMNSPLDDPNAIVVFDDTKKHSKEVQHVIETLKKEKRAFTNEEYNKIRLEDLEQISEPNMKKSNEGDIWNANFNINIDGVRYVSLQILGINGFYNTPCEGFISFDAATIVHSSSPRDPEFYKGDVIYSYADRKFLYHSGLLSSSTEYYGRNAVVKENHCNIPLPEGEGWIRTSTWLRPKTNRYWRRVNSIWRYL